MSLPTSHWLPHSLIYPVNNLKNYIFLLVFSIFSPSRYFHTFFLMKSINSTNRFLYFFIFSLLLMSGIFCEEAFAFAIVILYFKFRNLLLFLNFLKILPWSTHVLFCIWKLDFSTYFRTIHFLSIDKYFYIFHNTW